MSDGRPIFVVGAPRTGTTLVKEVLNRHREVHLFDEVHFFERIWDNRRELGDLANPGNQKRAISAVREIVQQYGSDKEVPNVLTLEEYRRRLVDRGRDYRSLLEIVLRAGAELKGARHWGDSSPQDILYLDTIFDWFPNARVVALVRDPRAFLCSYKNYFRRGEPSHREAYNPISNSMLWKSYMTALLDAKRGRFAESVLVLPYEALVTDPDAQVRRLCEHVGVDFDQALLGVERMNSSFGAGSGYTAASGIFSSSKDRWREELTGTEVWLGQRVFGDVMTQLGYEVAPAELSRPRFWELARVISHLPKRLFNLLFRSNKPFKLSKLRRVLSLFGGR